MSAVVRSALLQKSLGYGYIPHQLFPIRGISVSTNMSSKPDPKPDTSGDDVLFTTVNDKGLITLNRPKALNALNLNMVRKIYPTLKQWENDNKKMVIIKGTGGKAFCAGGDIRAVTDSAKAKTSLYQDFFKEEYQLNALIGTLQLPYIALIDGVTMGGGVGLSVHAPFRVATEKTLFAMPETAIGLFPDVGGSYFLPRLGGRLGLYLALTGYRLKGADVFRAGVATHMCDSNKLEDLERDLFSLTSDKHQDIDATLKRYHDQCVESKKEFSLGSKMDDINKFFSGNSMEEILSALRKDGSDWSKETEATLLKMSPTSLKTTLRLLTLGGDLSLLECLQIEYRLSQRCCEATTDFIEGVRALLVDKDQQPKWNPTSLEGVTEEIVDKFFSPLSPERELEL